MLTLTEKILLASAALLVAAGLLIRMQQRRRRAQAELRACARCGQSVAIDMVRCGYCGKLAADDEPP